METPTPAAVKAATMIQEEIKSARRRTGCVDVIPGTNELGAIIDAMKPRMATTYTKSYVSGEFGDTSKPLEFVTLKTGDVDLANLPLREIVHMVDDLREEIERYRMEHKPDTRHRFVPNKKFPWFCRDCGYPPEHPVMHLPAAASLDSENAKGDAPGAIEKL